jgi:uncharacterized protein YndB with AHSA1/START domain
MNPTPRPGRSSPELSLERTFQASIEDVWALWTTKAGIESWWGPEGFTVAVRSIDLRVGGTLHYVMTATGPNQVAFMERAGMPLATEAKITFTEIVPLRRLAYLTLADFVPGLAAYEVAAQVELFPVAAGVRMVVAFDRMHDETWTERAIAGWESQLGKLEARMASPDREMRP